MFVGKKRKRFIPHSVEDIGEIKVRRDDDRRIVRPGLPPGICVYLKLGLIPPASSVVHSIFPVLFDLTRSVSLIRTDP
jgi:hypothetical protein